MFDKSASADLGRRSLIRAQRGRKTGQACFSQSHLVRQPFPGLFLCPIRAAAGGL